MDETYYSIMVRQLGVIVMVWDEVRWTVEAEIMWMELDLEVKSKGMRRDGMGQDGTGQDDTGRDRT